MTNLRFVLTGVQEKTTTLQALAARGFQSVPDSARAIIQQRKEAGLTPRPAPAQFGTEMLQKDTAQYQEASVHHEPVFFDRGVCDTVALLYFHGPLFVAQVATYITAYPYNGGVFLLPPWPELYTQDAEGDQSLAEARAGDEIVQAWYRRWRYQLVEVPRGSVEGRAEFVVHTIEERAGYKGKVTHKRRTHSDIECRTVLE